MVRVVHELVPPYYYCTPGFDRCICTTSSFGEDVLHVVKIFGFVRRNNFFLFEIKDYN